MDVEALKHYACAALHRWMNKSLCGLNLRCSLCSETPACLHCLFYPFQASALICRLLRNVFWRELPIENSHHPCLTLLTESV